MIKLAFDGIVTRAITNELAEKLENGRITKIYQPTEHDLVINVRNKGKNENLLISIHPNYARVHFTDEKLLNPKEPPMFCMVLRKHLTSGIIEKVEQINLERIIHISIKSHDEIGGTCYYRYHHAHATHNSGGLQPPWNGAEDEVMRADYRVKQDLCPECEDTQTVGVDRFIQLLGQEVVNNA